MPERYPLSLHDALPIYDQAPAVSATRRLGLWLHEDSIGRGCSVVAAAGVLGRCYWRRLRSSKRDLLVIGITQEKKTLSIDRKSTCLNSSHMSISYALFC